MTKGGWYTCPICHRNLQKVEPGSILYGVPIYCRKCKVDWYPTIYLGRELADDEPLDMSSRAACGQSR